MSMKHQAGCQNKCFRSGVGALAYPEPRRAPTLGPFLPWALAPEESLLPILRLSAKRVSRVPVFAESLERPHIFRSIATQHVPLAALHHHTEVRRARRVPAVLHNFH